MIYICIVLNEKRNLLFRRSNDDWAQCFDDYPGRFKIAYPSPDDVNGLCFKNNLVRYDSSVNDRPSAYAVSFSFYLLTKLFNFVSSLSFKLKNNRIILQQEYQIESNR
jgi:hypothetical protein